MKRIRKHDRKGIAAVEAAVCLPVVILISLLTLEVNQMLSLKQQTQLLSSIAASEIVGSVDSFDAIETQVLDLADSLGLTGCVVTISQHDDETVSSLVELDVSANSSIGGLTSVETVSTEFFSYRVREVE